MKAVFFVIVIFLCSSFQVKAQNRDSLIQLCKGMGDTIDFIDREMFDLFRDIQGFKYAQLFIRNNQSLVSRINCIEDGIEKRLNLMENISELSKIKHKLTKLEEENIDKRKKPPDVLIPISVKNIYAGKLTMFSKKYLFLDSDSYNANFDSRLLHYKIPISQVNYLTITDEVESQNILKYTGYGAIGGGVLGFILGFALDAAYWDKLDNFERGAMTGLIGIGFGSLVGLIIGASLGPSYTDFTITFNSPNDILKLKEYSAYYYQPDKIIEEKYVEIE